MRNGATFSDGASSSTSLSSQQEVEDDRMIAVVLSEEYAKLDGAVGRRLSDLAPVPHVPKINMHFPSTSDSNLDYQRLLQRYGDCCSEWFPVGDIARELNLIHPSRNQSTQWINVYGLYEVKVSGDGNCQFRALSDQIYRSPEYHKHVRKDVVKQLKDNHAMYEAYVPMRFKRYYKKMAKSGEWGDHVTLQAAADKHSAVISHNKYNLVLFETMNHLKALGPPSVFAAKICLLTSFRDTCFIEIVPQHQAPMREIWLSFWSEVHYNSLYERQGAPPQHKPRKKHWLF